MATLRIPITQKISFMLSSMSFVILYMISIYLNEHMDLMYNPLWQFDILL